MATAGFNADAGLERAEKTVGDYSVLLREFPIKSLLAASDLRQVKEAIARVFRHFMQKSQYPLSRKKALLTSTSFLPC